MKRIVSGIMLTILLVSILALVLKIQPVKAEGTIYIRADGSIDPSTTPISTTDNITYTLIDNIYDSIVIERDNIVVDGLGYSIQGTGIGIDLGGRSNVTIKNTNIKGFYYGITLSASSSNNSISENNIICNNNIGIYTYLLGYTSANIISRNIMMNNTDAILIGG